MYVEYRRLRIAADRYNVQFNSQNHCDRLDCLRMIHRPYSIRNPQVMRHLLRHQELILQRMEEFVQRNIPHQLPDVIIHELTALSRRIRELQEVNEPSEFAEEVVNEDPHIYNDDYDLDVQLLMSLQRPSRHRQRVEGLYLRRNVRPRTEQGRQEDDEQYL